MVYLQDFQFHSEDRSVYPYRVIYPKMLDNMHFGPITILYGSNGCGKSTMLNVIAEKIGITKKSIGNTNEYFSKYARKCTFQLENPIPPEAMFIRSEDIMETINSVRKKNAAIDEKVIGWFEKGTDTTTLKGKMAVQSMFENIFDTNTFGDSFMEHVKGTLFRKEEQESNGETSIAYFKDRLYMDNLYLLDEPENSMAPRFQKELASTITLLAYGFNCQFVIATHSPFMLSMQGATIYDLDVAPSRERTWYQLENMKEYFELFNRNRNKFEKN